MEQVERIAYMEKRLDAVNAANDTFEQALEAYARAQAAVWELAEYYDSDTWLADFEADSQGKLPADLKRGVLSEDGAYNALMDNHDLALSMIEIATEILRNE